MFFESRQIAGQNFQKTKPVQLHFFNLKIESVMILNRIKPIVLSLATLAMLCFSACEIEEVENQNGPTLESLVNGASLADLNLLATGLEAVMRTEMEFHYWTVSIVGREYNDLRGTDPRFTGELLGAGSGAGKLDNNGFLSTRPFLRHYRIVKNANVLLEAVQNAKAGLAPAQELGFNGYAKTLKAYGLLLEATRQFEGDSGYPGDTGGIRTDVDDPDNLGPFTGSYSASLDAVLALLDEAEGDLSAAGDDFAFKLSSGFAGFDTPGTFLTFNRALYARTALYAGKSGAEINTELNKSFMDLSGDLGLGVYHVFGTSGNDKRNPLFNTPDLPYIVHPTFLTDAEAGDQRVAEKTTTLSAPVMLDNLSGDTQPAVFDSPTAPVAIIRNEELVLIYAEANIGLDNELAVTAINVVRNAAGLPDYPGPGDDASLLDEVVKQRRYALFCEGHRWVDMRRWGRLGELPLDRAGDEVFTRFPRPVKEEE